MKDVEKCVVTDKTIMKKDGVKIINRKRVAAQEVGVASVAEAPDIETRTA